MGFSKSSDKRWAEGKLPTNGSLAKIAAYFGVTTDMLLHGDCENAKVEFQGQMPKQTATENTADITRFRIIEKVMKLSDSDLPAVFAIVSHLADNSTVQDI